MPSVSRRHALLRRRGGQYFILDTNSSSGVFVNGQRVGPQGQPLSQGDLITIGGATIEFSAQPDPSPRSLFDSLRLPPSRNRDSHQTSRFPTRGFLILNRPTKRRPTKRRPTM